MFSIMNKEGKKMTKLTKEQEKVFKFITEECTKIALEKIHHYFTDFTCYDIPKFMELAKAGKQAFWMIRDTGTHLLTISGSSEDYVKNNELYNSLKSYNDEIYLLDFRTGEVKLFEYVGGDTLTIKL